MKNKIQYLLLSAVSLIVFNILFFLWVKNPSSADWVCYVAITLGFLFVCATQTIPTPGAGYSYSMTLPGIAVSYLSLAIIIGIVFMMLHIGFSITLTTYLILTLATIIWFSANLAANRRSTGTIDVQEGSLHTLRNYAFEIEMMQNDVTVPALKKALAHLADTVKCSPMNSTSHPEVGVMIDNEMNALINAVKVGNTLAATSSTKNLETLFARRNRALL